MIYYVKVNSIFDRSDVHFLNQKDEKLATVNFNKVADEYQLEAYNMITDKKYFVKSSPFKLKSRFVIFNEEKKQIVKVTMGYKILHNIIQSEDYYFVKSSFWKIRYSCYKNRKVTHHLSVIKTEKGRFFKIDSLNEDFSITLALFLLAHAVRSRSILN
ncbi:hypothetical protein OAO42_01950 [Candidatus Izimaplasma bacterium]|nr:hypothetical protein [Candidatus Izimaplasma bacterium]